MLSSRTFRRWTGRWLVLSVLFLQLATTAHACMLATAWATTPSAPSVSAENPAAGAPCELPMALSTALDESNPALCLSHCQFGSTQVPSGDAGTSPAADTAAALLFVLPVLAAEPQRARGDAAWATWAPRTRPPPHSLEHCCLRL